MKPILPDSIRLSDYQYALPEDRIAKFPLEERSDSKLLHYENGRINHTTFKDLPNLVPENSLMIFNNTKVIPARLVFQKESGSKIEIFLLKPYHPSPVIQEAMLARKEVSWEAMIGKLKKWKEGEVLEREANIHGQKVTIKVVMENREKRTVKFSWNPGHFRFVAIVETLGEVPLPPYLNRSATEEDRPRYQTVYSKNEGAVAAPTAGLHFTDEILSQLSKKGVKTEYLTLHVGAGTFQPVSEEHVSKHPMHSEQVLITQSNLEKLIEHEGNLIAVGTTSMRSLESIYWYGVKLLQTAGARFFIEKLFPYEQTEPLPTAKDSFQAILERMKSNKTEELTGDTEILIMPGYEFKVCNGLITNFHQPGSTLILLVAAFTHGQWRAIYEEALSGDYRFLSYGDSNLLWNKKIGEEPACRR